MNIQNDPQIRCRHYQFPMRFRWKHFGEWKFIGDIQYLHNFFAASLFSIGSLAELLIPIGPLF